MSERGIARGPRRGAHGLVALVLASLLPALGGCKDEPDTRTEASPVTEGKELLGSWVYRSFYNDDLKFARASMNPPATALGFLWAEGTLTLDSLADDGVLHGKIVFAPGIALDLSGRLEEDGGGGPMQLSLEGAGIAGTPTASWKYAIEGWVVKPWNVGAAPQRETLVGSVVNTVEILGPPPIGAPLGTVGSFMMLRTP